MSLSAVDEILDKDADEMEMALERRLTGINQEIQVLRGQHKVIQDIIKSQGTIKKRRIITKDQWVAMLQAAYSAKISLFKYEQSNHPPGGRVVVLR